MVARTPRRLPGFRFEVQSPPLGQVLPRMDVAVFVGFAATGPLNIPVAVEDVTHFSTIFGDDLPLAWDQQRGEIVYAYLAPAVRAFFRNGGRRCWVVRVAGGATANYFPIPGLAEARLDDEGNVLEIRPAFAQARAKGSWSDRLRVSAALLTQPVTLNQFSPGPMGLDLALTSPGEIVVGDLLRLTFRDEGYVLMLVVNSIVPGVVGSPPAGSPPQDDSLPGHSVVHITGGTPVWFSTAPLISPLTAPTQASMFTHDAEGLPITVGDRWLTPDGGQTLQFELHLPASAAPEPGSLLRIDFPTQQLWLNVQDLNIVSEGGSPLMETVWVTGQGLWWLKEPPSISPTSQPVCERLNFELDVQQDTAYPTRLSNLAFEAKQPFFWGALPTDEQLYQDRGTASENIYARLWEAATLPRFPLAGTSEANVIYFPIAMSAISDNALGPDTLPGTTLERDGLSQFSAELFLDPDQHLLSASIEDLLAEADFLRYQSPLPRALKGIYATLPIDEATLIAVPDAAQRGWYIADQGELPLPASVPPFPHPEWWHFLDCDPPPVLPLVQEPQWGNFLDCAIRVVAAPLLYSSNPDEQGTFALTWSSSLSDPDVRYILEEAVLSDFSGAVSMYEGKETRFVVYGRSQGTYYYHVRVESGGVSSDWSPGVPVQVVPTGRWLLNPVEAYAPGILLTVHRALLRMCAARGDMFTVLALPGHYREDDAENYVAVLKSPTSIARGGIAGSVIVDPLGIGEASAFSYGAVYHPWLIGYEEDMPNDLRQVPPDGAMCGIMAQRALTRGAWIAPANELLTGVVALAPPIARARRLDLQEAQINLIRQEPRGFISLSADTLSDDENLRPINVRRLLILLRRLALKLGTTYVFEPNNEALQRLVRRGFADLLGQMFARGAFAGDTPDTAFQVVTDSSLNTPESVEEGRFIVELRVAPSLPMTFLTIRLVQTNERGVVTEAS